jgi:hypothetical protein
LDSTNPLRETSEPWTDAMPTHRHATRRPPELDPRARDIIQAANMLEVSEFDFLGIAYREWYGHEPARERINAVFGNYMFGGEPPFWAHRLAREVIGLFDRGELDRSRFGVRPPPPPTLQEIAIGIGQMIGLLILLYLIFHGVLSYSGHTGG